MNRLSKEQIALLLALGMVVTGVTMQSAIQVDSEVFTYAVRFVTVFASIVLGGFLGSVASRALSRLLSRFGGDSQNKPTMQRQ